MISESLSYTDEAFAILLVINYEERWRSQHELGDENLTETRNHRKKDWTDAAYTSATEGSRRGISWSKAGLKKFNDLCLMVRDQRANARTGGKVETDLRVWCRSVAAMPPFEQQGERNSDNDIQEDGEEEEEVETFGEGNIFEV